MTFLGHSPPFPFYRAVFSSNCTHTPTLAPAHTFNQPPTIVPTTSHHHATRVPPFALRRNPPFFLFIFYFFFPSLQPYSPFPIFLVKGSPWVPLHTQITFVLVFPSFARGWIVVKSGFATLNFGNAHQVLDKRSELVCIMPRAQVSSSRSSPTRPPRRLCNPPGTCVFACKFRGMIYPHLLI